MKLTHQSIDALIPLCIAQDQAAYMEVYNRYYIAMYNTALRIVKDGAEAEDVMQESFINAFAKLDTFNAEATFGSWLKRIVVNNSINAYQKKERLAEVPLEKQLYKLEDNEGLAECDTSNVTIKTVLNALNDLKESYRVSLTLHLIEGYDYEEIGEILNISYANSRTVISRAKESLRKKLLIA